MVCYRHSRSGCHLVWILALIAASSSGFAQVTSDQSARVVNHAAHSQAASAARTSTLSRKTPSLPLGQVIYDNGPANGNLSSWQINFGFIVSDTFVVGNSGATIGGLSFAAWLIPGDTLSTVEVSITSGELGGTTYFDKTVNFSQSACTKNSFGYDVCTETASFAGPNLSAGTYWVNLQKASVPSGDAVFWDENSGVGCQSSGCPSTASENMVGTIASEAFEVTSAPVSTTTTLTVTPSSAVAGEVVTLQASVVDSSNNPVTIGTVTFLSGPSDFPRVLGTVQATDSPPVTATLKVRFGPGVYSLTALYKANKFFQTSQSQAQPLTVTGTEPTISTLLATPDGNNYDFALSVFGFGFPSLSGTGTLNNLTQGGSFLGNIGLAGPGMSTFQPQKTYPTGTSPFQVAVADFNGDGIADLAVTDGVNTVGVLLGNSDGTFQTEKAYATGSHPYGVAVWDFNGDGFADLVITNNGSNTISVLLGNGDGTFQPQQTFSVGNSPGWVAIADFNEDGIADLAIANDVDNTVGVLLGNGNGTFQPQQTYLTGSMPLAIVTSDFNGDGIPDLAVTNSGDSTVGVLLGNGDGTFQQQLVYATGAVPFGLAVADFNGDGLADLATADQGSQSVSVLLGNGNGTFQPAQSYQVKNVPVGVAVADFNGNGILDLAATNAGGATISILLGNGDGTFQPQQTYPTGISPYYLAVGDFNGDGVPDLAVPNLDASTVSILLGGTVSTGQLKSVPVIGSGNQQIQSTFTPNGTFFAGSLSNIVTVVGNGQIPTTTQLTSSQNPSSYLQPVTFTATVTGSGGGGPTGTVTFTADQVVICNAVPLVPTQNGSVATCLIATLQVGGHSIVATYSGDSNFAPSQSPQFDQVVNEAATTTVLTANPPSPSSFGEPVTFMATVSGAFGGSPTGTVNFTDNKTPIPGCTGVVLVPQQSGSTATCTTASLTVGSHTIAGNYGGDPEGTFSPSSGSIPYTVVASTTATTLSASPPSPVPAGQVITLTATVTTGSSPVTVGTVTFSNGTQVLGTVQMVQSGQAAGTATLKTRFAPGSLTLVAQYDGTKSFQSSQSSPQPYTVTGTEPTISTLSATPDGNNYDFALSVFGFGFPPLSGSGSLNNLTQGGINLGTIQLPGPLMSTFQPQQAYSTGNNPTGVAIGDFNGDGIGDLAVSNLGDNTVSVLLGKGDGTFQPQQTYMAGLEPAGVAVGDFNGDGIADLAVTNTAGNTVSVLLGNGDGTFQPQQTYATGLAPDGIAVADFNGDGIADLAVTNGNDDTVSVLLGNGDGTFQPEQPYATGLVPTGIAVADFNGDGIADLAVTNSVDNTVSVLLGKGDGTFQPQQPYGVGISPTAIAVGDFNGDGIADLAVTDFCGNDPNCQSAGTVSVLVGKGDGTFQPQQTYTVGLGPEGIAVADFNGDGFADLAVTNRDDNNHVGTVGVLLGKGDGTFQPQQTYAANGGPFGIAVADFNGDGVPDVAIADHFFNNSASVLLGGTITTGQLNNVPVFGVGNQNIQSTFTPNGTFYAGSLSNIVPVGGEQIPTATTLSSSQNPSSYLQPVTFTATVTDDGRSPTGTVTFTADGNVICAAVPLVPIQNGSTATCLIATLTAGSHNILASYSGDSTFAPSSGKLTQTVAKSSTTTLTTSAPNPSQVHQLVTIMAVVSGQFGGTPTGTVNFSDGTKLLCMAVLLDNSGKASCQTQSLAAGTHQLGAFYSGDNNFSTSSGSTMQTVNNGSISTSTQLVSSLNPSAFKQPVTFTATVTAGDGSIPSGSVTFQSNGVNIPDCPNPANLVRGVTGLHHTISGRGE